MPIRKITPCLWFDTRAEDAAGSYCSIFPNSRILDISHYGEAGHEIHGMAALLKMQKLDIAGLQRTYQG